VIAYGGWPNGLKIAADGRIVVADDKRGLMELDAKAGRMQPLLTARNSESFRGCNDLHLATNGDIYFTDQGQSGLHDPTGRVYRLSPSDRLYITESATGTVLVADISALDQGEHVRRV
jgi:gluconolactonase